MINWFQSDKIGPNWFNKKNAFDIFETQGKLAIYLFYRDANYIQALYYGHVTFHKDSDHLFLSLILSVSLHKIPFGWTLPKYHH